MSEGEEDHEHVSTAVALVPRHIQQFPMVEIPGQQGLQLAYRPAEPETLVAIAKEYLPDISKGGEVLSNAFEALCSTMRLTLFELKTILARVYGIGMIQKIQTHFARDLRLKELDVKRSSDDDDEGPSSSKTNLNKPYWDRIHLIQRDLKNHYPVRPNINTTALSSVSN